MADTSLMLQINGRRASNHRVVELYFTALMLFGTRRPCCGHRLNWAAGMMAPHRNCNLRIGGGRKLRKGRGRSSRRFTHHVASGTCARLSKYPIGLPLALLDIKSERKLRNESSKANVSGKGRMLRAGVRYCSLVLCHVNWFQQTHFDPDLLATCKRHCSRSLSRSLNILRVTRIAVHPRLHVRVDVLFGNAVCGSSSTHVNILRSVV